MRLIPMLVLAAALVAPQAASAQRLGDNVVDVAAGNAEMNAAKAQGRATLPVFFEHFAKPDPGERGFLVKYDLLSEPDLVEFIWAEVVSHTPGVTVARLVNAPRDRRFKLGAQVTIHDEAIIDWGYFKNGVMQGNFTTRVLLPNLTPAEADAIRKAYGW